jgi:hypothetical protein
MKQFSRTLMVVAVLMCLTVPATAATIDSVGIFTTGPGGAWQTGAWAAIGISDPGGTNNPFYNDLGTGAILPPGIPSGTYLAFLGYESYWPTTTAQLLLHYSDSTTRSATFQVGDIHASGGWTLLSGDPLLSLGGGGFDVTPDRVGTSGGTNITPIDGVPDVVLQFSDNGDPAGSVPEPATLLLLSFGFVGMTGAKRFRK